MLGAAGAMGAYCFQVGAYCFGVGAYYFRVGAIVNDCRGIACDKIGYCL